jgi:hypothetical protein
MIVLEKNLMRSSIFWNTLLLLFLYSCDEHSDKRNIVEAKLKTRLNDSLISVLNIVLKHDQEPRDYMASLIETYGYQSNQVFEESKLISMYDYDNLVKVRSILDKYGWLGPETIGRQGNDALFLVIQHADIIMQRKYLPMMRRAVIDGKAKGSQWAMLEDRVSVQINGTQIYGTQVGRSPIKPDSAFIEPIHDEINVNKRRANVGLEPLEDYARSFGLKYHLPIN